MNQFLERLADGFLVSLRLLLSRVALAYTGEVWLDLLELVVVIIVFLLKLFFQTLNLEALLVQLGFSLKQFILTIFVLSFEETGQVRCHVVLDSAVGARCRDFLVFYIATVSYQVVRCLAKHIDLEIVWKVISRTEASYSFRGAFSCWLL